METTLTDVIARPNTPDGEMMSLADMLLNPATLARMPEAFRRHLNSHRTKDGGFIQRSNAESNQIMADLYNKSPGILNKPGTWGSGYDCPNCLNRGDFQRVDENGNIVVYDCDCMEKRRYFQRVRQSGLSEMLTRYTLANWQCREPWQRNLLEMVRRYAERPQGWLCMSGRPGTGKTHMCTALCGLLLEKGFPVRYMLWKDVSIKAKAVVNDSEAYAEIAEPLKRVAVLYIDDFLKTGKPADPRPGQRVTPAAPTKGDANFAADIIYARYNDSRLITIISTEMTIGEIMDTDEGTASRIYERTKNGGYQSLTEMPNWRLM